MPQTSILCIALGMVLMLCLASSARAEEPIATHPILPAGYASIRVFDTQGRFVGRILPEKRYWATIDRIPAFLQKAVIAVEDARFYEHSGIDVRGIARALVKDVVKGRLAEGGSTITQQLIKNKYLTAEKTLERKFDEARMAMDYEKRYTKKQILEMYLNEIYYGNGAWGIAQAARLYFDKNPEELTDAECSLLAGVPKNPARYNPLGQAAKVTGRRDVVLARMLSLKMITPAQKKQLRANPPSVIPAGQAPYYIAQIRSSLIERYGPQIIDIGGLDVISAMDLKLQTLAEKSLTEGVRRISPRLQGALLTLDPVSGDILAAVGGVDAKQGPFNRAFSARRQPGSAIKPLIYAAALENGFTAASIFDDAPVSYNRGNNELWKPLNYGGEQYGSLPLRQALAHSNNVITVKLLEATGVHRFIDFAGRAGLQLSAASGLSLALGTEEVTLNELVQAYTPFANNGLRSQSRIIIRIFDRTRRTWTEYPPSVTPAMTPAAAYVTTRMLEDVMVYGTAKSLNKFKKQRPSAGKTGTTDDYRDAWFVGYTPQLITGVWIGHDRPQSGGKGFTGGAVAAPVWERFMRAALAGRPAIDFPKPETVVTVTIDPATGYPAKTGCPEKRDEFFADGTEPVETCPEHGGEPMNRLPLQQPFPDVEMQLTDE